jgi:hypothetical protein
MANTEIIVESYNSGIRNTLKNHLEETVHDSD